MKIEKIEFKNIFAYGEKLQTIEYTDKGKLVLLQGQSGTGKTAILSLPCLLLYGKLEKIPKNSIANRINKNGYIKGTIIKNNHEYIIKRKFVPNSLTVYKDGQNIENYGSKDAQDYIDNEIIDVPYTTFANLISISMKKFKSFLNMSPKDRRDIIDRVFSLEIINHVFEMLKKDIKELGNAINADNATMFSLNTTLQNANNELVKLQEESKNDENAAKINENIAKIKVVNENLQKYIDGYSKVSEKFSEVNSKITETKNEELKADMNIKAVQDKIDLFSQEKCPTCGTPFSSDSFDNIKKQLQELKENKQNYKKQLADTVNELNGNKIKLNDYLIQINNEITKMRSEINAMNNENIILQNNMKASAEFQSITNIINKTTEQIAAIKNSIDVNNDKIIDLQNLQVVYSVEGVKQKVIDNYLPILNKEIADNLIYLNFPYQLEFDNHFESTLSDLGNPIAVETLSDGEMTRIDIVVLTSLIKLLKRRYPSINILSIDELLSSLDSSNAEIMLSFLKRFAEEMNLNIWIVSHISLTNEVFDEAIETSKSKGFSEINYVSLQK